MLHNPHAEIGQGARRRCTVCNQPLTLASTAGRPKIYCSATCRLEAFRFKAATTLAAAENESLHGLPNKILKRNPEKISTKSIGQKSAFSALGHDERRELFRIAREIEYAAWWPLSGLRS